MTPKQEPLRVALTLVLTAASVGCVNVRVNYVDPMETESDETSESDDSSASDDDPSTVTTDPTDPSTSSTTTDPSTSSSDTGPVDPCEECLTQNCANELAQCIVDEDCACVLDCLQSGGGFMECPAQCGVMGFPPALTALGFCAATACMGECQFP